VLRLTAQADDIPKESDIVLSTVEADYDFVDVAGREHKFAADSTIDFGTPKK